MPFFKCGLGEGDCDKNEECETGLICGRDNCPSEFGFGDSSDDCCRLDICFSGDDDCCKERVERELTVS